MHRKLKEFIGLLRIVCPGCGEGFQYSHIFDHMAQCEEAARVKEEGRTSNSANQSDNLKML